MTRQDCTECTTLNSHLSSQIKEFEKYSGVTYTLGSEPFMLLCVRYYNMSTGYIRCSSSFFNEDEQYSIRWKVGFLVHREEWRDLEKYGFVWRR